MAMVKVIYVDQSAGKIAESRLDDLIAKGKIAAFYGSDGWVAVKSAQISSAGVGRQHNLKERRKEHETAGNKGISQAKRDDTGEDE